MTKEWLVRSGLAAVLAGALLAAGCGGGESTDTGGSGGSGVGVATLSWSAPSENTDGSAATNLAGYRIYHGTRADSLDNMIEVSNPGVSVYVVERLPTGTNYFSITAYNSAGVESDRSPVASKSIM